LRSFALGLLQKSRQLCACNSAIRLAAVPSRKQTSIKRTLVAFHFDQDLTSLMRRFCWKSRRCCWCEIL